ncbi:hypothetical protein ONO23_06227 [Micromonospora noduli]|nr:hypothetical protein ONO23_06227 [Micromonospora noduli]
MVTTRVPAAPLPPVEKIGIPKSSLVPAARSPRRQVNFLPFTRQPSGTTTRTLFVFSLLVSTV